MKVKSTTMGDRLARLREEYSLTPERLAALVGVTRVAIDNMEKGVTKTPRQMTVDTIAERLGTTPEWILKGDGEMLPNGKVSLSDQRKGSPADQNPWKDVAFQTIAGERDDLRRERDRLWDMIQSFMKGNLTFLQPVEGAA